jgi:hypothetical protein
MAVGKRVGVHVGNGDGLGVGAGVNDPAGTKNPNRPTFLEESVKRGEGIIPISTVGMYVTVGAAWVVVGGSVKDVK